MAESRPAIARNRNCGAMSVHRRLLNDVPAYAQSRARIENMALAAARRGFRSARQAVHIPVVVHVVWHTSAENISEAQIESQIEVLNRDFRATNPDKADVPAVFQDLIADSRLEFHLATTDPDGHPTNGITRTETSRTEFSDDDSVKFSARGGIDAWPTDRYLNVWVCNLQPWLGYAQFPGGPAETDGVVITHEGFGTTGTATAPFDRGRTTTHEIGHWFNLYHIWGDDGGGCSGTDEVADTPNQGGPNYGCPGFPHISCGNGPNGDMFMNYMDYVDDACMVMFTEGQVRRMDAALEGPRSSFLDDRRSTLQVGQTTNTVTDDWYDVDLAPGFANPPVVLASIETFDGPDTAGLRLRDVRLKAFSIKIEEEQSKDRETGHTTEVVGYVAVEPGLLCDDLGNVIGEAGVVTVNQQNGAQWHTVNLRQAYCNPVVIMQLMSFNGSQPAHTRLRNVDSDQFDFQIEEWDYLDQSHTTETIGYLVIERRRHRLADGTVIEAGAVETNHDWAAVSVGPVFTASPVTLSHCQTRL
jgi:hypothetical protein